MLDYGRIIPDQQSRPSCGAWSKEPGKAQVLDDDYPELPERQLTTHLIIDAVENIKSGNGYAKDSQRFLNNLPTWIVDFLDLSPQIIRILKDIKMDYTDKDIAVFLDMEPVFIEHLPEKPAGKRMPMGQGVVLGHKLQLTLNQINDLSGKDIIAKAKTLMLGSSPLTTLAAAQNELAELEGAAAHSDTSNGRNQPLIDRLEEAKAKVEELQKQM